MLKAVHMIRHGITDGIEKHWYYGALDLPLVQRGCDELRRLKSMGIYPDIAQCAVFTTGLIRTEQTLETLYGRVPHGVVKELREMNFGDFEGYSYDELKERADYVAWLNNYSETLAYPNGESAQSFYDRISCAYDNFSASLNSDAILVAHGGTIGAVMLYLFPDERPNFYSWLVEAGRGYTVYYDNDGGVGGYAAI